jgi:hypothetical protein
MTQAANIRGHGVHAALAVVVDTGKTMLSITDAGHCNLRLQTCICYYACQALPSKYMHMDTDNVGILQPKTGIKARLLEVEGHKECEGVAISSSVVVTHLDTIDSSFHDIS